MPFHIFSGIILAVLYVNICMKLSHILILFVFSYTLGLAQTTNTISGGLNDNDVNVVRDGDFPEEAGGVIKMVPKGKKEKVMTIAPDTLDGKQVGSPTPSVVPADSSIKFKEEKSKPIKTKSS